MKTATTVLQIIVRITGLIQIVLGLFIWNGTNDTLIFTGSVLVLALWALAAIAARARVSIGLVVLAVVWGLILPILGLTQAGLVPGSAHWVIQIVHLLLGLGAIGQAESLALRIKRAGTLAPQA
jgi:hypothetical protein